MVKITLLLLFSLSSFIVWGQKDLPKDINFTMADAKLAYDPASHIFKTVLRNIEDDSSIGLFVDSLVKKKGKLSVFATLRYHKLSDIHGMKLYAARKITSKGLPKYKTSSKITFANYSGNNGHIKFEIPYQRKVEIILVADHIPPSCTEIIISN